MSKLKGVQNNIKNTQKDVFDLIKKIETAASTSDKNTIQDLLNTYKGKIKEDFSRLQQDTTELVTACDQAVEIKTQALKKEIEQLKKTNDTIVSDNYLLEYKKKDLMLLADNLEEAYEEISQKNEELREQKRRVSEQAEKLQAAHEEILKKNEELEIQKESILDQAEYLHEANQTISRIHAEVEKQKNEILKKNKELVNLNNEKNNLIGIVAHDLKSPLNQIKGFITVIRLASTNLDEDTLKYLESIELSANRLNEMIAKILDIEAIEAQKLNIKLEKTNLSELSADCVERFKITAGGKDIVINEDIKAGIMANVDRSFVNQVYENLLSNAIKFSPGDTAVTVCLSQHDGRAMFSVSDEGPGISKEDQKKLFGKYQKLTAKPTGNETSTGLGLSIVKQFVEAMNGRIWCESKLEHGTTFFVEFDAIADK